MVAWLRGWRCNPFRRSGQVRCLPRCPERLKRPLRRFCSRSRASASPGGSRRRCRNGCRCRSRNRLCRRSGNGRDLHRRGRAGVCWSAFPPGCRARAGCTAIGSGRRGAVHRFACRPPSCSRRACRCRPSSIWVKAASSRAMSGRPLACSRVSHSSRAAAPFAAGVVVHMRPGLPRPFEQGQDFGVIAVFHRPVSFAQAMCSRMVASSARTLPARMEKVESARATSFAGVFCW